ncbi:hypothetical protein PCE1_003093 [Barthelona sp. PCE]
MGGQDWGDWIVNTVASLVGKEDDMYNFILENNLVSTPDFFVDRILMKYDIGNKARAKFYPEVMNNEVRMIRLMKYGMFVNAYPLIGMFELTSSYIEDNIYN